MRTFLLPLLCAATLAMAAEPPAPPIKVVLVGDSTVQSHSGWGDAFAPLLKPGVECVNLGKGGRSTKSYRDEGAWEAALAQHPDYLLIQFGHNDQPGKGPARETDPRTTYPQNLTRFVTEARSIGAQPILVTSLTRRNFEADGKTLRRDLKDYVEAVQRVGAEQHVPVVDLNARSIEQVEKLGPQGAAVLDADQKGKPAGSGGDHTHLSENGAEMTAPLVAEELRRLGTDLARYLR